MPSKPKQQVTLGDVLEAARAYRHLLTIAPLEPATKADLLAELDEQISFLEDVS